MGMTRTKSYPARPLWQSGEVAAAPRFLAREESSFTTGAGLCPEWRCSTGLRIKDRHSAYAIAIRPTASDGLDVRPCISRSACWRYKCDPAVLLLLPSF